MALARGRARPLLGQPCPAHKPRPCSARVPFGAVAAPERAQTLPHHRHPPARPTVGCAAAFSRYRGSQRPVPICLPSSRCPAPSHVENLIPPDISWPDNCCHCFDLAVAVTSPLAGLPVSPAPCRAAAVWGSLQTPAGRGRKLRWPGARRNREPRLSLLSRPVPGMPSCC